MSINKANPLAVASHGRHNSQTNDLTAPGAVVLTAQALSSTTVELYWTLGFFVQYFYLERKIAGGSYARVPDTSTTFTTASYQDTSCAAGTDYVYRLTSYNVMGTAVSNEYPVSTPAAASDATTDLQEAFIDSVLGSDFPFRQQLSYTVFGSTAKTIYAVVNHGGMKKVSSRMDKMPSMYDVDIVISNDTTDGIKDVKVGKDTVVLLSPEFRGKSNTFIVAGIIAHTPMAWHLGLKP